MKIFFFLKNVLYWLRSLSYWTYSSIKNPARSWKASTIWHHYIWNPKYDTNEQNCEKDRNSQTERTDLWLPRAGRGGKNLDFGIRRCKLLCLRWINDKVLLYSTGSLFKTLWHVYPVSITALLTIARTGKRPRCPSADEWLRKLWYMYTMEYYAAIKKNAL